MKEHKERKAREETIRKEIRRDENLYDGIDDFSQVLAVHDYYGVSDVCASYPNKNDIHPLTPLLLLWEGQERGAKVHEAIDVQSRTKSCVYCS